MFGTRSRGRAIGLDAGNCFDRPPTGVAVYARNLTAELADLRPDQRFVWHLRSNRYLRSFRTRLPRNARRRLAESLPWHPSVGRVALFHGLNQRLPPGPLPLSVATFHDLFAMSGGYATAEFRSRFTRLAEETAIRANHIIAISAHTARLVTEQLCYPRECVTVVHHGVETLETPDGRLVQRVLEDLGVSRPFVLHVGTLQARKNIGRLVAAFEAAGQGRQLVLAGSLGYGAREIVERIEASPARSRVRMVGHVADTARACLYRSAEALLFPSLDEGFGLPAIEAMACGLPVVTSTAGALPEVAGDAAILVDPLSVDSIAEGLGRVLASHRLRAALAARGAARAGEFTWKRCAERTWEVYQRLLG